MIIFQRDQVNLSRHNFIIEFDAYVSNSAIAWVRFYAAGTIATSILWN
ncbi:hypothetical protein GCM10025794_32230 [Massilia kyonggiensis]